MQRPTKRLASNAVAACGEVLETYELRAAILCAALDLVPSAPSSALMWRWRRLIATCKGWERALRETPTMLRGLLTRLALDKALPVERLGGALALPVHACRPHYRGPGVPSIGEFERAFGAILGAQGGWEAAVARSRHAAQQAVASSRATAADSQRRQGMTAIGRVEALHTSLQAKSAAWEAARRETETLVASLRASRARERTAETAVGEVLTQLDGVPVSLGALQATQVSVSVSKLLRSSVGKASEAVNACATRLLKRWQAVAAASGRKLLDGGVVDRSGKRPEAAAVEAAAVAAAAAHGKGAATGSGGKRKLPASIAATAALPPRSQPTTVRGSSSGSGSGSGGGAGGSGASVAGCSNGVQRLREHYAALEQQKKSRSIVALPPGAVPKLKRKP